MDRIKSLISSSDALLFFGVFSLILLLIVPLPPLLLDALLCFNIVFSVMALLLTLYVEKAMEFSSFPSLLLFLTLYRLGLNIASTRMILTRGQGGDIIGTFGSFVTHNNTLVGLVLFALLTVINFIVVTKGAGRVAEVAARFTLEALPGKQMAIDSQMQAGVLDPSEADERRERISEEAQFYGAMDGASKFVRGDAIASLVITLVNIVGGFAVGFFVQHYSWQECWRIFTTLTVGDGLVSQIPALLISVAAGVMVTRASSESVGKAFSKQLFNHPKVLLFAGVMVLGLALIPGMPLLVMLPIGGGLLLASFKLVRGKSTIEQKVSSKLEICLGVNLIGMANQLHAELPKLRAKVQQRVGVRLGHITISDSMEISPNSYCLKLRSVKLFQGRDKEVTQIIQKLEGAFETHAHELITRQDVARLLADAKKSDAACVADLKMGHGQLLKILQELLQEGIPIVDFVTIIETLVTEPPDPIMAIRQQLVHSITEKFFGKNRRATVITVDPKVEKMLSVSSKLRPRTIDKIGDLVDGFVKEAEQRPILMTTAKVRKQLSQITAKRLPTLPVLSYDEVEGDVELTACGTIGNEVLL
ncbi:MAG: Flagellar biosynthesis protein FlhA [Chlamydiales bacterium]|nr:Flagellar biosynthesis protein FlhA [Chlamydiales bacterium]MCH9635991.1 Flagellar biosynthesis protein FlhA [Chlamydiales bacterium]MCH9703764.1 flagellar biosynthesis protein FlhA [Chlamydiota bacterium]